ncbi:MAG: hypothetical protein OXS29_15695 [bacterium]|nr:hypothetical protein [bacterium]MDE0288651.1 hypothetical protein [bacterium]MDE0437033.1 hypothetical protein [bacterium]
MSGLAPRTTTSAIRSEFLLPDGLPAPPVRFSELRRESVSPLTSRGRQRRRRNIYGGRRTGSRSRSAGGRGPKKNRYAHIIFAVLVVAVALFVFTRDEPDPADSTTVTTGPSVTATTGTSEEAPDPTQPATTTAAVGETAGTTTPTASPGREGPALNASATTFLDGLAEVKATLAQLVAEISAANEAWDNRDETGARFEDTEATITGVIDGTRTLQESVMSLPVPSTLADRPQGLQGLVRQATELVPLAEAVLEGLRLPSPDDGSARREALDDFVAAAGAFTGTVDDLIRDVEENAQDPGLTPTASAATTTTPTTTPPPAELSGEALAYINGLQGFKQALADLVAQAEAANQAWDNSAETGVTYRETAAALGETIDQARSFNEQVRGLTVPVPVGTLGDGPIQHAARLPALAEGMLDGLRIPAPDDGSARRSALAALVGSAEDFAGSVDSLVAYIEENAAALGLVG